ncbi:MAG: hypothetical protein JWP06_783 [Candidatus Saccharibacteria bacterium]|nr:hypothetical protein [Candidatus Saccharibacteria bacterium]
MYRALCLLTLREGGKHKQDQTHGKNCCHPADEERRSRAHDANGHQWAECRSDKPSTESRKVLSHNVLLQQGTPKPRQRVLPTAGEQCDDELNSSVVTLVFINIFVNDEESRSLDQLSSGIETSYIYLLSVATSNTSDKGNTTVSVSASKNIIPVIFSIVGMMLEKFFKVSSCKRLFHFGNLFGRAFSNYHTTA